MFQFVCYHNLETKKMIPGFDGGMEQYFLVTVTDRTSGEVAYNQTTTKLDLLVQNLSAGSSYLVIAR